LMQTGAHAPVGAEDKKESDEKSRKKDAESKSAQQEVAKLTDDVGPLLLSDLAKVEERRENQEAPVGVQMIQEGEG
jgi:hypothetical protein